jgi:receptor protein-tyrosine kinase
LIGLGLALAIVIILDRLDQTVRTNQDAMDATSLQVLGTIPFFKNNDNRSMTGALESYRKLRTTLRFIRTEGKQVIMVTSPAPSEGKSATAANLAWVLANDKLRVILVDADMRRPTQHILFTKERFPGLSDVLVGEAELADALVEHSGLTVLPSGTTAPNPADLLSSAKFAKLITELRTQFDRIIVDCPPVHAVADATTIASESDGVLLVVRAEFTNGGSLSHAVEQLNRAGADILGVVMNGVPSGAPGYGGYYGYYDYSGYRLESEPRGVPQIITSPNGAAPKSRWRLFAST